MGIANHSLRSIKMCLYLGTVSALGFTSVAIAQGTPGDSRDIIVTANKRAQSINDVGLAISALSGNTLREQNIVSLSDLAQATPGLSYASTSGSTPVYTLRGVGFYDRSFAASPAVSVYVDQVPLPFPALTTHTNFDLERVEVLKGPQGTLFGQNSTGGAINFIAAKPTDSFDAGGDISYGRFNRIDGNFHVSGPLTDTLRARLAITGAHGDEWQYSYTRKDRLGEVSYYGARLLLDWNPTDNFRAELNVTGWRDQSDPQAPQYRTLLSQAPGSTAPELLAYPFAPFNARAADWTPSTRPHMDNRLLRGSLRMDWDITDNLTVTSLTSYVDWKAKQGFENDGTALFADDYVEDNGFIRSFNQELRLANNPESSLRWVAGANFEKSHVVERQLQTFGQISTAAIFGYTGAAPSGDQHMRNYAFFGNIEYDVTSQLTLKAGVRYTNAKRDAKICNTDPGDGSFAAVFSDLAQAIQLGFVPEPGFTPTGTILQPLGIHDCVALNNVTLHGQPPTYLPGLFEDTLKEDNVSWRAGVDYRPSSNVLLYVNVAKGFKAGSYPVTTAATWEQWMAVTQESLVSYEAGFKVSAFDHLLQVDGAGFYYDYKNKQMLANIVDPVFGVLPALTNIPKSRLLGGELNVTLRPAEGLSLSANGSIIDSKVRDYIGHTNVGNLVDLKDAAIPYTPKYQLRVSADYTWQMGSTRPFVGAVYSVRSHSYSNIGGTKAQVTRSDFRSSVPTDSTYTMPGYSTVDVRAGAYLKDEAFRVEVFGKNIFNKYYVTNIYSIYDTIVRNSGMPATYGIRLSYNFK